MDRPTQDVLRSPSGRVLQVIRRGPERWRGFLTLPRCGRTVAGIERRRLTEAFVTSLQGAFNTFDVPIYRGPSLTAGTNLTLTAAPTIGSGLTTVQITGITDGILRGQMFSINGQLYRAAADMSAGSVTALPALIEGDTGDSVLWDPPMVMARLAGRGVSVISENEAGFTGPWIIEWESA